MTFQRWELHAAAAAFALGLVAYGMTVRRFDTRRWSTVFPVGMAGLTGLQLSSVLHQSALYEAGRAISWLALAVWALVVAASLITRMNLTS